MNILILCTGNSCRSQMAEAVMKSLNADLEVHSAGTNPAGEVHPKAVAAMKEIEVDITSSRPKHVNQFLNTPFDYVITVCGGARESCPAFTGKVKNRMHIGFDDPAQATGTEDEIMSVFRGVRDEIVRDFSAFYKENILLFY